MTAESADSAQKHDHDHDHDHDDDDDHDHDHDHDHDDDVGIDLRPPTLNNVHGVDTRCAFAARWNKGEGESVGPLPVDLYPPEPTPPLAMPRLRSRAMLGGEYLDITPYHSFDASIGLGLDLAVTQGNPSKTEVKLQVDEALLLPKRGPGPASLPVLPPGEGPVSSTSSSSPEGPADLEDRLRGYVDAGHQIQTAAGEISRKLGACLTRDNVWLIGSVAYRQGDEERWWRCVEHVVGDMSGALRSGNVIVAMRCDPQSVQSLILDAVGGLSR